MKIIRNGVITMAIGIFAVAMAVIAPVAHASAGTATSAKMLAWDDQTGVGLQAWECSSGDVCFWNGSNGTGSRCAWDVADPDWTAGNIRCSWATTSNVKSVMNMGTSPSFTGVVYYLNTGYNNRIGCTRQQHGGNLAGTYQLRSHHWTSGRCG